MFSDNIKRHQLIVENEFGSLNDTQINKKVDSKRWSIAQCLDHLIVTNEVYLTVLNEVLSGKHKSTFWERLNPFTNYTGKNMIKTLGPVILKKYNAPKQFLPRSSGLGLRVLNDFKKNQEETIKTFDALENGHHLEKVITSPIAPLITLRIRDVMRIICVHEERHIKQALLNIED